MARERMRRERMRRNKISTDARFFWYKYQRYQLKMIQDYLLSRVATMIPEDLIELQRSKRDVKNVVNVFLDGNCSACDVMAMVDRLREVRANLKTGQRYKEHREIINKLETQSHWLLNEGVLYSPQQIKLMFYQDTVQLVDSSGCDGGTWLAGPFVCYIKWWGLNDLSRLTILPDGREAIRYLSNRTHPHAEGDGLFCLGSDNVITLKTMAKRGDIYYIYQLMRALIKGYNKNTSYFTASRQAIRHMHLLQNTEEGFVSCPLCASRCGPEDIFMCSNCGSTCCENCYTTCYRCDMLLCRNCVHNVGDCAECGEELWMCMDSIVRLDGHNYHEDCTAHCSECGSHIAGDSIYPCSICGAVLCYNCTHTCNWCDNTVCNTHLVECTSCDESICLNCRNECSICGEIVCDGCHEHCTQCGELICSGCHQDGVCTECLESECQTTSTAIEIEGQMELNFDEVSNEVEQESETVIQTETTQTPDNGGTENE